MQSTVERALAAGIAAGNSSSSSGRSLKEVLEKRRRELQIQQASRTSSRGRLSPGRSSPGRYLPSRPSTQERILPGNQILAAKQAVQDSFSKSIGPAVVSIRSEAATRAEETGVELIAEDVKMAEGSYDAVNHGYGLTAEDGEDFHA